MRLVEFVTLHSEINTEYIKNNKTTASNKKNSENVLNCIKITRDIFEYRKVTKNIKNK